MAFVGIFMAALVGGAFWYWRFKALKGVADDVGDVIGRARGAYRMGKFRKQAEASPLTSGRLNALAAAAIWGSSRVMPLLTMAKGVPAFLVVS